MPLNRSIGLSWLEMRVFSRRLDGPTGRHQPIVGHDKSQSDAYLKQWLAPGLRRRHTPFEGNLGPLLAATTSHQILAMMRSILMQHVDIVSELRGVGSA